MLVCASPKKLWTVGIISSRFQNIRISNFNGFEPSWITIQERSFAAISNALVAPFLSYHTKNLECLICVNIGIYMVFSIVHTSVTKTCCVSKGKGRTCAQYWRPLLLTPTLQSNITNSKLCNLSKVTCVTSSKNVSKEFHRSKQHSFCLSSTCV